MNEERQMFQMTIEFPNIQQIIESAAFQQSKRISVYLSLDSEVSTNDILSEMFRLEKEVNWEINIFDIRFCIRRVCVCLIRRSSFRHTVASEW